MTITGFLLARIAEDEAAAQAAHRESMRGHAGPGFARSLAEWSAQSRDVRGHDLIARMTPARVLAECEAKRRIVAQCGPYDDIQVRRQTRTLAGDTLRLLAAVYSDHPDYDDTWSLI